MALRESALDHVDARLLALGRQGLDRLTPDGILEIRATARRARVGGLVRLERQLDGLSTLAQRYRDRDPLFRSTQWLESLNRTWLLARAIRRDGATASRAILGESRRTYVPLEGAIEVEALAAEGWLSDSGFVGVTVYLGAEGRILQASNAKPSMRFGVDPRGLYDRAVSPSAGVTVAELAHGASRLEGGRTSLDDRLSLGADLVVSAAPSRGKRAYDAIAASTFEAVWERMRHASVDPLGGGPAPLVFVEPAGWGETVVDDTHAEARLPITDRCGAVVACRVAVAPHTACAVDNLVQLGGGGSLRPDALVGWVRARRGEMVIEPLTLVFYEAVELAARGVGRVHRVHLGLEPLATVRR